MDIKQFFHVLDVQSGVSASLRMLKLNLKKSKNEKMKVVFICQLSQIWSCFESIYACASQDDNTEAILLTLPEAWPVKEGDPEADSNAYTYLKELGYNPISGYDYKKKKFKNLRALNPDYVFFPRPYDHYLPDIYKSREVSKYAKVCYLCYGYTSEGDYILKTCFTKYFISNCYMVFAENKSVADYCHYQLPISSRIGLHKIIQTPFPRFDLMHKFKNSKGSGWSRKREDVKTQIIWTPRWTLDEKLGGTNFFNYKNFFFRFANDHSDTDLLIRPHPLAFDNFLAVGAMTAEEIADYKNTCANMVNVALDTQKEYLNNFSSADILVSDMSGVVVDFAVTGKPVIFCSYKQEFNKSCQKLLDAYYIVHNETELSETLSMLCNGEDPKKEVRLKIIKEILGECDGKNGERIFNYLKSDFK